MAELHRVFTPELEIRSAGKGGDGRTITGIAVPYNRPQRIDSQLTEQFARGAFDKQVNAAHRIKFSRDHMSMGGALIGRTTLLRDDAAGLYGEWRVSNTPAGEETLELVKDGALTDLSIGFREGMNRRLQGGVIERQTAHLFEVSVVMEGAYGEGALIGAVRSNDVINMCSCGATERIEQARLIRAALPELPEMTF